MRVSNSSESVKIQSTEVQQESMAKGVEERPNSNASQELEHLPSRSLQDSQVANTRKSEQSFDTSMRRAILAKDLQSAGAKTSQEGVAVGGTAPKPGANSGEVLQLNDRGPKVADLQNRLNEFRIANGQPPISTNGVYTQETADAVKEFQEAMGLEGDSKAGPNTNARLELETSKTFKKMNGLVQDEIRTMLNEFQHNPAARENLLNLVKDREFSLHLSATSQIFTLGLLKRDPANPKHFENTKATAQDVSVLEGSRFFQNLPSLTQLQMQDAMFEHHASPAGREGIMDIANSFQFPRLSSEQQISIMQAIRNNPGDRTAPEFARILSSQGIGNTTDVTKNRIIDIAVENASNPDSLQDLTNLLNDPGFVGATEEEQGRQLNEFRINHGFIEIL